MKEFREESSLASASPARELPRALCHPEVFGSKCCQIEVQETHLSYLFFTEHEVFKLKKAVIRPFIDLSTAHARLINAKQEIILNRRLAKHIYFGLTKVTRRADGCIELDGDGEIVDWLVHMRRLPQDRMLDVLARSGGVVAKDIELLTGKLVSFYDLNRRATLSPSAYLEVLKHRLQIEHESLLRPELALPEALVKSLMTELVTILTTDTQLFTTRVCDGKIVDGHGDLRPEHICLTDGCPIFDCLEFSAGLRTLDTADELAYLTMELKSQGAPDIGEAISATYQEMSGDHVPPIVHSFYFSYRARLRARLCIWHLYDCPPAETNKWRQKASSYLNLASMELGKTR